MTATADPVPLHRLRVPDPEAVPVAIGNFDSIGPASRADYPHRHTFYELVLVTAGSGDHVIDFAAHRLRPPQLLLITPGQVHYWRASGLRGRVLLFTEAFLAASAGDRATWQRIADRAHRPLTAVEAGRMTGLLAQMEIEYHHRGADFVSAMRAYLYILLLQAARVAGPVESAENLGRAAGIAGEFIRLLHHGHPATDTVADYAARLGVSPGHLAASVKSATGRTPGQHIRRWRTLEARRLLGGTDLTVAQVSRHLGFDDPSYFCRFFRRETGSTPTAFRQGEKHLNPGHQSID